MDCSISVLFLMLLVAVAHTALTPHDYWKMTLPNTPMPAAIRDLFRQDVRVGVEVLANAQAEHGVGVGGGGVDQRIFIRYFVRYRRHYGKVGTQTQGIPDETIFFLEKDMHPGVKMRLDFTRSSPAAAFIPRGEASTIPFFSKQLPAILSRFSVQPNSAEAKTMAKTLDECEEKDPAEETKYCATSLESMIDFATSSLETHDVRAVSSEFAKEGARKQDYVVASAPREKLVGSRNVACHPTPYPYAVFYCHVTPATKIYVVPLVGEDGAKVDAVAVCHTDTSAWSPEHLAFQMLKVKPGAAPICHFLPQGGILWARRHLVNP